MAKSSALPISITGEFICYDTDDIYSEITSYKNGPNYDIKLAY